MADRRHSDPRVVILLFPFAARNALGIAKKMTTAVSSVSSRTIFVSGGIPADIAWPDGVQVHDIGVQVHYLKDRRVAWLSAVSWVGKALLAQFRLAREVFRLRCEIDVVICTLGSYYQLPILTARFLKKKVLSLSGGVDALSAQANYGNIVAAFVEFLAQFSFAWSHAVVVESVRLGQHRVLARSRSKLYHGALFLDDLDRFCVRTPVQERENLVGYVGRLTAEKGVMEFVQAIPLALEQRPDLEFLILGTGRLDAAIEMNIKGKPWAGQVTWLKWVEHERVPDYLNQLKLVVIPSYTEGLPNLVLEAMGCGTPILATSVGGIPDLVVDGKTGFVLKDNTPQTIAGSILEALASCELARISANGRQLIEDKYSFAAAVERYGRILDVLTSDHSADDGYREEC